MRMNWSDKEKKLLQKLDTPVRVQDFLNTLRFNFELDGDTFKSPLRVLRTKNAHCLEGAVLGAYILSLHGHPPLLVHLGVAQNDFDHVIAPFRVGKFWGALSKTNHSVLRYREPVYRDIRELCMSYFHEYFLKSGRKTMRTYSKPLNLSTFEPDWPVSQEDLWGIDEALDEMAHYSVAPKETLRNMRRADSIEVKTGEMVEWKK